MIVVIVKVRQYAITSANNVLMYSYGENKRLDLLVKVDSHVIGTRTKDVAQAAELPPFPHIIGGPFTFMVTVAASKDVSLQFLSKLLPLTQL